MVGGFLWNHGIPGNKCQGISRRKRTNHTEEVGPFPIEYEEI